MGRKKTHEEVKEEIRLLSNGEWEIIGEYINKKTKILLKNATADKEYYVLLASFKRGSRPPKSRAKTQSEFEKEIRELTNGKWVVDGEYRGAHTKIILREVKTGIEFLTKPNTFLCGGRPKKRKLTESELKENRKRYREENKELLKERGVARRKTISGLISQTYHGQRARNKRKFGTSIPYSLKELRRWILSQNNFSKLYSNWVKNNYITGLRPSVDRIDNKICYSLNNIQLITWEENNKKGRDEHARAIFQYDLGMNFIKEWRSAYDVEKTIFGYKRGCITKCCKGDSESYNESIWKYKEEREVNGS